eukprot:CAMPEP_0185188384 /NCGR_PEP_ID=MMETSP1140-20130426/5371_1 /TAXON_ID=298111 /ORGANISM="Pavlova sp., Strain CCMP459" /LENGTH=74 /DNA_ID=CAMNT_0027754875 /DNA_START=49 /DNA_END=270 /DNA_ORIENTATION=-
MSNAQRQTRSSDDGDKRKGHAARKDSALSRRSIELPGKFEVAGRSPNSVKGPARYDCRRELCVDGSVRPLALHH